jgi:hypothetical protein
MSVGKLIRELYDAGERDPDVITTAVLDKVLASEDPRDALRSIVSDRVRTETRRLVRGLERSVDLRPSTATWSNPATQARERLLKESVWVPGYGRVAWGQLTIEQHQRVIKYYSIAVAGYQQSIAKHMEAIQIIQQHPGALCLDDCGSRGRTEASNLTEEGTGNGNKPARAGEPAGTV